jgi:hypothetical protein
MVKPTSMNKYRVFLKGVNFQLFDHDSRRIESLGFYTNAFVEADSLKAAELLAVDVLRQSPELRDSVQNAKDDPPRIFVEEIVEIADWPPDTARPLTGLALYDEAAEANACDESTPTI